MRRWPKVRRQRTGQLRRNVLRIHEDPQQDEECFSDAGADELLRAVREAAARDVRHKVGEESCEAKEREKAFGERRPLRSTVKCKAPTGL